MRHGADWPLGTASSAGTLTSTQETVADFTYDSAGGRVKQVTSTATTHYLGELYEVEATATGSTPAKQIFLGPLRVATRRTGTNTGTFFSHPDHLGSTALLTNAKGEVAQRIEYLPFGSVWKNTGAIDLPQKFTGKPLDSTTGLYYFGARYYDPELGRWTTPDPTIPNPFNPQSLNRYTYVDNNPLKYTDPTGLKKSKWKQWLGKIVGAIAAAVTFAVTGNAAAAYAVYNLVDSVTTAAVNGGDIGRALAGAVASAALNFALPGAGSTNFLINAGVNAARSAGIAAVTAAITGGDPARAALGGLVSGASSVIPYVGTIVGGGAAAEVQGGKFATGAIGGAFDVGAQLALSAMASGSLQEALDAGGEGGTGNRGNIVAAINKIAKTTFGQSTEGMPVVKALRVAYHQGRIGFANLNPNGPQGGLVTLGGYSRYSGTIQLDPSYVSNSRLPGVLAHEGTHMVLNQRGAPYNFANERAAFNAGYAVGSELGDGSSYTTDDFIRQNYGDRF